jgi:hypothetical protein
LLKFDWNAVESVEVPGDNAVPSTLFDIRTHSLVLESTLAISGRDVVVNVGLSDRDVMVFRPSQTLVQLPPDAILSSITVLGYPSVNCGGLHAGYIKKP